MSAAHAIPVRFPAQVGVPRDATPRPRLRVVPPPAHTRTRVPFVVLCMSALASALLGTLLLNTSMAQGGYQRDALQTRLAASAQSQQQLLSELELAASPEQLTVAASAIGMVQAPSGGYLRLSDGAVLGSPAPAGAGG